MAGWLHQEMPPKMSTDKSITTLTEMKAATFRSMCLTVHYDGIYKAAKSLPTSSVSPSFAVRRIIRQRVVAFIRDRVHFHIHANPELLSTPFDCRASPERPDPDGTCQRLSPEPCQKPFSKFSLIVNSPRPRKERRVLVHLERCTRVQLLIDHPIDTTPDCDAQ